MKKTIAFLILAASAGAATILAQPIANSVSDFSGTQGSNGWWYGYYDLTTDVIPGYDPTNDLAQCPIWTGSEWWVSSSNYWTQLHNNGGHPNGATNNAGRLLHEQWAVRRWVSTLTGPIRIQGQIAKENASCGDGTTARVFLNGQNLFGYSLSAGDSIGTNYVIEVNVSTGDLIDFAIGAGCCGDVGCDSTKFTATIKGTAPIRREPTGHYYEFVRASMTWQQAVAEANSRTYADMTGHLATITSFAENEFIKTNFWSGAPNEFAWIAGREPNNNGVWRWAAGPETDLQFSQSATPTPPFNYANWGSTEPNNSKPDEDYLMFNIGQDRNGLPTGKWADGASTPSVSDPVVGYLVEYEPPLSLAIVAGVQICFPSALGVPYQVQYSDDAGTSNWSNLGGIVTGTGQTNCVFDPFAGPQRFYRVQIAQ